MQGDTRTPRRGTNVKAIAQRDGTGRRGGGVRNISGTGRRGGGVRKIQRKKPGRRTHAQGSYDGYIVVVRALQHLVCACLYACVCVSAGHSNKVASSTTHLLQNYLADEASRPRDKHARPSVKPWHVHPGGLPIAPRSRTQSPASVDPATRGWEARGWPGGVWQWRG